jgi:hypothetical protein
MVELSKLNPMWESDEVVNFMFDNGYTAIVNDMMDNHGLDLYYEADDVYELWNSLKTLLK